MSKAIKCNVCKTCFDPLDLDYKQKFIHMDGFKLLNRKSTEENTVYEWPKDIDFCPECSKKFMAFFLGRLKIEEVNIVL